MNGYEFVTRILSKTAKEVKPLIDIANGVETDWMEFKAATKLQVVDLGPDVLLRKPQESDDDVAWTVVKACFALANSIGGVVLIGVAENKEVGVPEHVDLINSGFKTGWDWDKYSQYLDQKLVRPHNGWRTTKNGLWKSTENLPVLIDEGTYLGRKIVLLLVKPQATGSDSKPLLVENAQDPNLIARELWFREQGVASTKKISDPTKILKYWSQRSYEKYDLDDMYSRFEAEWVEQERRKALNEAIEKTVEAYRQKELGRMPREVQSEYVSLLGEPLDVPELEANVESIQSGNEAIESDEECIEDDFDFLYSFPSKSTYKLTKAKANSPALREDIYSLIENEKRALLVGDPGSGKSTCLKHFLYRWAQNYRLGGEIKIYLPLNIVDAELWSACAKRVGLQKSEIMDLAKAGRVTLLLDGLNECRLSYQKACIGQIELLLTEYPDVGCVLSARATQYDSDLALKPFRILPLTEEIQFAVLVSKFGEEVATSVVHYLSQNIASRHIAKNPGLLVMFADLYGESRSTESWSQALIHRKYFEKWHELGKKGVAPLLNKFNWTKERCWSVVQELSFRSRLNGWFGRIDVEWSTQIITKTLGSEASSFVYWLGQGVLFKLESDDDHLSYVHETLQESFAAYFLLENPDAWSQICQLQTQDARRYWLNTLHHAVGLQLEESESRTPVHAMVSLIIKLDPWVLEPFHLSTEEIQAAFEANNVVLSPHLRRWLTKTAGEESSLENFQLTWTSGFVQLIERDPDVLERWRTFCLDLLEDETSTKRARSSLVSLFTKDAFLLGLSNVLNSAQIDRFLAAVNINSDWDVKAIATLVGKGLLGRSALLRKLIHWSPSIYQAGLLVRNEVLQWSDFPISLVCGWGKSVTFDQAALWTHLGSMQWTQFDIQGRDFIEAVSPAEAARWAAVFPGQLSSLSGRGQEWIDRFHQERYFESNLRREWLHVSGLEQILAVIDIGQAKWSEFSSREHALISAERKPRHLLSLLRMGLITSDHYEQAINSVASGTTLSVAVKLLNCGDADSSIFADRIDAWTESADFQDALKLVSCGLVTREVFNHRLAQWEDEANASRALHLVRGKFSRPDVFSRREDSYWSSLSNIQLASAFGLGLITKTSLPIPIEEIFDSAAGKDMVAWVTAGDFRPADLEPYWSRFIQTIEIDQAAKLVDSSVMTWRDFEHRRFDWTSNASLKHARLLVSSGYSSWDEFGKLVAYLVKCAKSERKISCIDAANLIIEGLINWKDIAQEKPPMYGAKVKGMVIAKHNFTTVVELGGCIGVVSTLAQETQRNSSSQRNDKLGKIINLVIQTYVRDKNRFVLDYPASGKHMDLPKNIVVNAVMDGVVRKITQSTVFVEIAPGVSGRILRSLNTARESWLPDIGRQLKVKIRAIDYARLIITLQNEAVDTSQYAVGAIIDGKVAGLTSHCAFVKFNSSVKTHILPFGELILSGAKMEKRIIRKGDPVRVKVRDIKSNGRITLSLRSAISVDEGVLAGKTINGIYLHAVNNCAYVLLFPGVVGRTVPSDSNEGEAVDYSKTFANGDRVPVELIELNVAERYVAVKIVG